jgi:hypothetical protein
MQGHFYLGFNTGYNWQCYEIKANLDLGGHVTLTNLSVYNANNKPAALNQAEFGKYNVNLAMCCPILTAIFRGGKAKRSFIFLRCCLLVYLLFLLISPLRLPGRLAPVLSDDGLVGKGGKGRYEQGIAPSNEQKYHPKKERPRDI